jgi:hypothetical protein
MRHRRPPRQPPSLSLVVLIIVVVLTVAIGGWYFFLRNAGQQSEFLRAHERVVAAERIAEAAINDITRFLDLEAFDATVQTQIKVMQRQAKVFRRLAQTGGDDEARLADEALVVTERVINSTRAYSYSLVRRRLAQNAGAIVDMQAGVVELDRIAAEWEAR